MDLAEVAIARVCGVAVEIATYDCVVSRGILSWPLYRRPGLKELHEFV